jgi:predicted DNA-binding transcriptional regulator AlpA
MMIEQHDPGATASVRQILTKSPAFTRDMPFFLVPAVDYSFGAEFVAWLESEIAARGIHLLVLDSYTALRGTRPKGGDVVKAEQSDLRELDAATKSCKCGALILHHASKGSAALDWSQQAAGTFAMSAATEGQIFMSRFSELDGVAPERLIRVRGRHSEDVEMVLRFRKDSLDYEHVLEGAAASSYPAILQIRAAFGSQVFEPKQLMHQTGISRATAHRLIERLHRAGELSKRGYREYALSR